MPRPEPARPVLQDGVDGREDEPLPRASDDEVLEDTARLAREGRRQLESDPNESKPASE